MFNSRGFLIKRLCTGAPMTVSPWAEMKFLYMSEARITSGVFAAFDKSTGCAVGMIRNAPPAPVALLWQAEAEHVFVTVTPFNVIGSCFRKTGFTQRWK